MRGLTYISQGSREVGKGKILQALPAIIIFVFILIAFGTH